MSDEGVWGTEAVRDAGDGPVGLYWGAVSYRKSLALCETGDKGVVPLAYFRDEESLKRFDALMRHLLKSKDME